MRDWIKTDDGNIPVHRVIRHYYDETNCGKEHFVDKNPEYLVDYDDGRGNVRTVRTRVNPDWSGAPLVPAMNGYYVLRVYVDDLGVDVIKDPVVAWRLKLGSRHGLGRPVTLDPDTEDEKSPVILCPDGQVVVRFDQIYENLDGYVAEQEKHQKS